MVIEKSYYLEEAIKNIPGSLFEIGLISSIPGGLSMVATAKNLIPGINIYNPVAAQEMTAWGVTTIMLGAFMGGMYLAGRAFEATSFGPFGEIDIGEPKCALKDLDYYIQEYKKASSLEKEIKD